MTLVVGDFVIERADAVLARLGVKIRLSAASVDGRNERLCTSTVDVDLLLTVGGRYLESALIELRDFVLDFAGHAVSFENIEHPACWEFICRSSDTPSQHS